MEKEWAFLVQAGNDIEAEIICGLLRESSIPVQQRDIDSLMGFVRVVGGYVWGIDIFVPRQMLPRARAILATVGFNEKGGRENNEPT
ncbi:MAG: DUF2007 domain-containing protein [Firmicutes bacterium]|nr:DUF2007 domain-containing protein [Bacillota bacterium]